MSMVCPKKVSEKRENQNYKNSNRDNSASRESKFKRALRLQFWLILQNLFCRFLTESLWKDSDMIHPSIESSDFLFWHDNNFKFDFWKFCGKQTKWNSQVQIYCVFTHTLNFKEWNFVCLFPRKFSKNGFKTFFMPK